MQHDDADAPELPEVKEVTVESGDAPLVLQGEPLPPTVPTPEALIRVFRLLRERIPEFTQLSVEEERSMIRAAHLDPEFLADSLRVAEVWEGAQLHCGMTAEELRDLDDKILHWDRVEKEFLVIAKGIAGANRSRRHRRGKAALDIYFGLRMVIRRPEYRHLLPYFESMQRSYMKNRKTRKKKEEKVTSPPPPGTEAGSPD